MKVVITTRCVRALPSESQGCSSGCRMGSVHDWQGGLEGLPVMLTVDEAARVLRIGRTLAYQLATRFLDGQPDGLPVIRLGGCLRVPRWALVDLIHRNMNGMRHSTGFLYFLRRADVHDQQLLCTFNLLLQVRNGDPLGRFVGAHAIY